MAGTVPPAPVRPSASGSESAVFGPTEARVIAGRFSHSAHPEDERQHRGGPSDS